MIIKNVINDDILLDYWDGDNINCGGMKILRLEKHVDICLLLSATIPGAA